MIPACPNQARFESCDHCLRFKSRCRGIELRGIRSLNFLFVCVRIRSLPRAPESRARRSRSVHRAGKLAFRKQKPSRGGQKHKGSAHPKGYAARQTPQRTLACAPASAARRQGCPDSKTGPKRGSPTKACATDETPTAPRPTIGTPPLKERRRQESHREDDGGAFHQ